MPNSPTNHPGPTARRRSVVGRVVYVLCALFFVYATVVQLNDIDSPVWIAIYLVPAGVAVVAAFNLGLPAQRAVAAVAGVLVGIALVWGAMLLPAALKVPSFAESEVAREVGGLAIVALFSFVVLALHLRGLRRAKAAGSS